MRRGCHSNAKKIKEAYFRLRNHFKNTYVGLSEPEILPSAPFDFDDFLPKEGQGP